MSEKPKQSEEESESWEVDEIIRCLDILVGGSKVETLVAVSWKALVDESTQSVENYDGSWIHKNDLEGDCEKMLAAFRIAPQRRKEATGQLWSGKRLLSHAQYDMKERKFIPPNLSLSIFKYGGEGAKIVGFDEKFNAIVKQFKGEVVRSDVRKEKGTKTRPRPADVGSSFVVPDDQLALYDFDDVEDDRFLDNRDPKKAKGLVAATSLEQILAVAVEKAAAAQPLQKIQLLQLQDFLKERVVPELEAVGFCCELNGFELQHQPSVHSVELYKLYVRCTKCGALVKLSHATSFLEWNLAHGNWVNCSFLQQKGDVKLVYSSALRHAKETGCSSGAVRETRSLRKVHSVSPGRFVQTTGSGDDMTIYLDGNAHCVTELLSNGHDSILSSMWANCARYKFQEFLGTKRKTLGGLIQLPEKQYIESTIAKCLAKYLTCDRILPHLWVRALFLPSLTDADAVEGEQQNHMFEFFLSLDGVGGPLSREGMMLQLFEHLKKHEAVADGLRYYFKDQKVQVLKLKEGENVDHDVLFTFQAAGKNAGRKGAARNPLTLRTHINHHCYFLEFLLQGCKNLAQEERDWLIETLSSRAKLEVRGAKTKLLFARYEEFVMRSELMFLFMETLKMRYLQFASIYNEACMTLQKHEIAAASASPSVLHNSTFCITEMDAALASLAELKRSLFEDPRFVRQHLAAFMMVVLLEIGCQRPQVFHGCVYIQLHIRDQFLSQTVDPFVSGIVEETPGRFSFVICSDKVKNYTAPVSFTISKNGAAVFRIFVMMHQYWRAKYKTSGNANFPVLKGMSRSGQVLFHPMFLQVTGKQSNPLKALQNDHSFELLRAYVTDEALTESLEESMRRQILENVHEGQEMMDIGKAEEEDMFDVEQSMVIGLDEPENNSEDWDLELNVFEEGADVQLFDNSTRKKRGEDEALEIRPSSVGVSEWKELENDFFRAGPVLTTTGMEDPQGSSSQQCRKESLEEFFRHVRGHRILRVYYVQYKSYVFADAPEVLQDLAALQRHGHIVEETDYAPFRIQLQAQKSKEQLGSIFGQSLEHYGEDDLMKAVKQHLIIMRAPQPVPTEQTMDAVAKLGNKDSFCATNRMGLQNLKEEAMAHYQWLQDGNWPERLLGTMVKLPLPMLIGGIIPVFSFDLTPTIACSKCQSLCQWLDLSLEKNMLHAAKKLRGVLDQNDSQRVLGEIQSGQINVTFMFCCLAGPLEGCAQQFGFLTSEAIHIQARSGHKRSSNFLGQLNLA